MPGCRRLPGRLGPPTNSRCCALRANGPCCCARDLTERGRPTVTLTRLVLAGKLERAGRGLYSLPDAPISEHRSLAEVSVRVPKGVVCLTDRNQSQVDDDAPRDRVVHAAPATHSGRSTLSVVTAGKAGAAGIECLFSGYARTCANEAAYRASRPHHPIHRLQFRGCTHHLKTSLSTAQHAQPVG